MIKYGYVMEYWYNIREPLIESGPEVLCMLTKPLIQISGLWWDIMR